MREFLIVWHVVAAKSLQPCLTLCDLIDGSLPGSSVPGILQARTQEWVAISFSNEWKWKVKVKSISRVQLLATPWTAAYQAPLSIGFSRQEYWSGVPLPSPFWHEWVCYRKMFMFFGIRIALLPWHPAHSIYYWCSIIVLIFWAKWLEDKLSYLMTVHLRRH